MDLLSPFFEEPDSEATDHIQHLQLSLPIARLTLA